MPPPNSSLENNEESPIDKLSLMLKQTIFSNLDTESLMALRATSRQCCEIATLQLQEIQPSTRQKTLTSLFEYQQKRCLSTQAVTDKHFTPKKGEPISMGQIGINLRLQLILNSVKQHGILHKLDAQYVYWGFFCETTLSVCFQIVTAYLEKADPKETGLSLNDWIQSILNATPLKQSIHHKIRMHLKINPTDLNLIHRINKHIPEHLIIRPYYDVLIFPEELKKMSHSIFANRFKAFVIDTVSSRKYYTSVTRDALTILEQQAHDLTQDDAQYLAKKLVELSCAKNTNKFFIAKALTTLALKSKHIDFESVKRGFVDCIDDRDNLESILKDLVRLSIRYGSPPAELALCSLWILYPEKIRTDAIANILFQVANRASTKYLNQFVNKAFQLHKEDIDQLQWKDIDYARKYHQKLVSPCLLTHAAGKLSLDIQLKTVEWLTQNIDDYFIEHFDNVFYDVTPKAQTHLIQKLIQQLFTDKRSHAAKVLSTHFHLLSKNNQNEIFNVVLNLFESRPYAFLELLCAGLKYSNPTPEFRDKAVSLILTRVHQEDASAIESLHLIKHQFDNSLTDKTIDLLIKLLERNSTYGNLSKTITALLYFAPYILRTKNQNHINRIRTFIDEGILDKNNISILKWIKVVTHFSFVFNDTDLDLIIDALITTLFSHSTLAQPSLDTATVGKFIGLAEMIKQKNTDVQAKVIKHITQKTFNDGDRLVAIYLLTLLCDPNQDIINSTFADLSRILFKRTLFSPYNLKHKQITEWLVQHSEKLTQDNQKRLVFFLTTKGLFPKMIPFIVNAPDHLKQYFPIQTQFILNQLAKVRNKTLTQKLPFTFSRALESSFCESTSIELPLCTDNIINTLEILSWCHHPDLNSMLNHNHHDLDQPLVAPPLFLKNLVIQDQSREAESEEIEGSMQQLRLRSTP